MKKIYIFLVFIAFVFRANAQQEHHYTQFMYNKLLLNPAYAGARGVPFITGILRNQWVGFDGAPVSQLVSFNSPFKKTRMSFGATLSHEKIGLSRDFFGSLSYSYKLIMTKKFTIRAGMDASYKSLGMDFAKAYPLIIGDASLSDRMLNNRFINVGAGVYAHYAEKWYIGFSVPQLIGNVFALQNPSATLVAKEYKHYYLTGGYNVRLTESLSLLPAVLLKYVKNAPFDADINLNLDIRKKTTVGLSYRLGGDGPGESLDFLIYRQITPHIGVGGAYDMTFSRIRKYSSGSFELLAQYDFVGKKRTMSNPRFFF